MEPRIKQKELTTQAEDPIKELVRLLNTAIKQLKDGNLDEAINITLKPKLSLFYLDDTPHGQRAYAILRSIVMNLEVQTDPEAFLNSQIGEISKIQNEFFKLDVNTRLKSITEPSKLYGSKPGSDMPLFAESEKSLSADEKVNLQLVTSTQKLIDGIDIAIRSRRTGPTNINIQDYFKEFGKGISDKEWDILSGKEKATDAEFIATINKLFDNLKANSKGKEDYVNLVLAINFGENCDRIDAISDYLGLDAIAVSSLGKEKEYKDKGVISFATLSSIDRLRIFFIGSVPQMNSEQWNTLRGKHTQTFNELMNTDQTAQLTSEVNLPMRRKHSMLTLISYSFAYQYSNYLQTMPDSVALAFLNKIGGEGNSPLPPPVPASILQHTSAIDLYYSVLGDNKQGFNQVLDAILATVQKNYDAPFGTTFKDGSKTKGEATDKFLDGVSKVSGKFLMDNLISLMMNQNFTDPNNPSFIDPKRLRISLRDVRDLMNVNQNFYGLFQNNLNSMLKNYSLDLMNSETLDEDYQKITEFTGSVPSMSMNDPQSYANSLVYGALIGTYLQEIYKIGSKIVPEGEPFKIREFNGAVNGDLTARLYDAPLKSRTLLNGAWNFGVTNQMGGYVNTSGNLNIDSYENRYYKNQSEETHDSRNINYDVRNVNTGIVDISSSYLHYLKNKNVSKRMLDVTQSEDSSFIQLLNSTVGDNVNVVVLSNGRTNMNEESWAGTVYVRENGAWQQIVVSDDIQRDADQRLQTQFAAMRQSWSSPLITYTGVENLNKNDISRIGGIVAFEFKDVSLLFTRTATGDIGIGASVDLGNHAVSVCYEELTVNEIEEINLLGEGKTEKEKRFLLNWKMMNKFALMASYSKTPSRDDYGLKLLGKHFGAGFYASYSNDKLQFFDASGNYSADISNTLKVGANVSVKLSRDEMKDEIKFDSGSGIVKLDIKDPITKKNIAIIRMEGFVGPGWQNQLNKLDWSEFVTEYQKILADMDKTKKELDIIYSKNQEPPDSLLVQAEMWGQELSQLQKRLPWFSDLLNENLSQQISMSVELPKAGYQGKLSFARLDGMHYVMTTHNLFFDDGKSFSVTVGRSYQDLRNAVIGAKYNFDNWSVGTSYITQDGKPGWDFSLSHVFPEGTKAGLNLFTGKDQFGVKLSAVNPSAYGVSAKYVDIDEGTITDLSLKGQYRLKGSKWWLTGEYERLKAGSSFIRQVPMFGAIYSPSDRFDIGFSGGLIFDKMLFDYKPLWETDRITSKNLKLKFDVNVKF